MTETEAATAYGLAEERIARAKASAVSPGKTVGAGGRT